MKTSILLVRILLVPLTGYLLGHCIPKSPCQEDVPAGKPLPIDGVWKSSLQHDNTDADFYYKIDCGRMYLSAVKGLDSLAYLDGVGKLVFCDIKFLAKNKYSCKIFSIYGTPSIQGVLEVRGNKISVTPRNPILIQELSGVCLADEKLYASYHK